jgi:hypothetical protein
MSVSCTYCGGVRFSHPFRLPVYNRTCVPWDGDASKPEPARYWEITNCLRCGLERQEPRGFVPGSRPAVTGRFIPLSENGIPQNALQIIHETTHDVYTENHT